MTGSCRRSDPNGRGPLVAVVGSLAALVLVAGCGGGNAAPATSRPAAMHAGLDVGALPPCPATRHVAPRADGLPALTLPCLGAGPAVRLSDLRGTPMVLNVWAAWCSNCADEAPLFSALNHKAGGKVRFFGIHYQASRGHGLASAHDFGVFYPSLQDADGAATIKALRAPSPPETWFVTADGRVAYRHRGVLTSQRQLDSYVATYLGVTV
jgi:cytochrome c biogenesis protein CcmG, thiol:disulfide interchange protein DsbE